MTKISEVSFHTHGLAMRDACRNIGLMEIAVLICGVADPKWPLPQDLSLASLQAHAAGHTALSPFDEAALELALKLRDHDPAARVVGLVAGDEAFARKVAGWRPDATHRIDLAETPLWDSAAVAAVLAQALQALVPQASLVLMGREFGDWDDGTIPAALAHAAHLPHVQLALALQPQGEAMHALRQGSAGLERARVPQRALLSVTNDPGNRLRHPLMKNVMLAKKAAVPAWRAPDAPATAALGFDGVAPVAAAVRQGTCEWITGTAQEQARALAQLLAAQVEG
jgi:electron transfer flavoprotein beta subunit